MIRASDKKIIVSVFGKHYSRAIEEHLAAKGFTNRKGEPYKTQQIKEFVNGITENLRVEVAIIDFTVKTKASKSRTLKAMAAKLRSKK